MDALNSTTAMIQGYGFGWFLDPFSRPFQNIGHGGATSGFSATIQRFPDDQLSIIILCNADETGLATALAKRWPRSILQTKLRTKPQSDQLNHAFGSSIQKAAPLAQLGFHPNLPAHPFHAFLDHGESNSCAGVGLLLVQPARTP